MSNDTIRGAVQGFFKKGKSRENFVFSMASIGEVFCVEKSRAASNPMGPELRREIISSYERVLDMCSSPVEKESHLPFSKELIRQAIFEELADNPDGELRSHLEVAFVRLESFLPDEEFEVIEGFKRASTLAQELAMSGDPNDIIASARIVKKAGGDKAVRIQESISEKMKKRLEQVQSIGLGMQMFKARRPCASSLEC